MIPPFSSFRNQAQIYEPICVTVDWYWQLLVMGTRCKQNMILNLTPG